MILALVFLAAGIVILTIAADHFVEGAVSLADVLNISPVVVGALVIGFGTSLPEMLVSGVAAVQGDADLGVGNVVGSNVANLSLVLGLAALITTITIDSVTSRRELPLCIGSVLLFALLVQGGFRFWEGLILAGALAATMFWLLSHAHDHDEESPAQEHDGSGAASALRTLLGLVGTVGGAWLLVEGGTDLADEVGLTGGFVGLTLVAIGTSLPEMVTAIVAARKRETDLIIGNLLGSNIFNSLAVGAVLGLLGPGPLEDNTLAGLATVIMIAVVLVAAVFVYTGGRVIRSQAVALLLIYFSTMPFTISTAVDCSEEPTADECIEVAAIPLPSD